MSDSFYTRYKTELCKDWEFGVCTWGDLCSFAHGKSDIQDSNGYCRKLKTTKCRNFWGVGYCAYGRRCCFIHDDRTLNTMQRSYYTYLIKIKFLGKN